MPNWKESADYDFTKDLDGNGWAWEFLRRNNNYAEDYKKCAALIQSEEKKHGPYPNLMFHQDESKHIYFFDPPKNENETSALWAAKAANINLEPHRRPPSKWYGKKWHISCGIQDPLIDKPPSFDLPITREAELINFDNVGKYIEDGGEPEGYIAIGFDLSAPIGPQWDTVKKVVQSKHKDYKETLDQSPSVSKHTKGDFKNYLRLLDAIEAGLSLIDIAKVLTPKIKNNSEYTNASQTIQDWRTAAKQLSHKDYRQCLLKKYP